MVKFGYHRTNYCQYSWRRGKTWRPRFSNTLWGFYEGQFDCRVPVLRTDGGGEYLPLNLFCKNTGVAREISEPRNQVSFGKAKWMQCTDMVMVRHMVFMCGLPLSFWGDAAEYAAYKIFRNPSQPSVGRQSPLQLLTMKVPILRDIVVVGSPGMFSMMPAQIPWTSRKRRFNYRQNDEM